MPHFSVQLAEVRIFLICQQVDTAPEKTYGTARMFPSEMVA